MFVKVTEIGVFRVNGVLFVCLKCNVNSSVSQSNCHINAANILTPRMVNNATVKHW